MDHVKRLTSLPLAVQWLSAEGSGVASQPSARMGWLPCSGRSRPAGIVPPLFCPYLGCSRAGWKAGQSWPVQQNGGARTPRAGPAHLFARALCLSPLPHGQRGAQGGTCTVRHATSGCRLDDRAAVLAAPSPGLGAPRPSPFFLPPASGPVSRTYRQLAHAGAAKAQRRASSRATSSRPVVSPAASQSAAHTVSATPPRAPTEWPRSRAQAHPVG
jgi:hypothetical protein